MNEWNIQSRAHACQVCGRHFADQQQYHTVLQDHRREVQRVDLCEACWRQGHADGASSRQGFISQWQGVYEQAPPAPPEAIQKENAESLLRRIIERNDPGYSAVAYILAAMLERKRLLKVKEQFRREGQRVFVYEHPKSGDVFTIVDPELQLNQLDQVQREVAHLLEHGFPGDTAVSIRPADSGQTTAVVPAIPAEGIEPAAVGDDVSAVAMPQTSGPVESEPATASVSG